MQLRGERNQCQGCKLYFRSNSAFDKHRTGHHGVDRRCRTPDEMRAAGMHLNEEGWWAGSAMPDDKKEFFNEKE